jgi:hypothetical protein
VNFTIPKGSTVYLGAPAKPLDQSIILKISELVAALPSVLEAHLPQCWIEKLMPGPAQILVLVVATEEGVPELIAAVGQGLGRLLPRGNHMDIWPLLISNNLIGAVRGAGCQIFGQHGKPIFQTPVEPVSENPMGLKRLLQRFKPFSK